ncbi:MAG: hypothetical protein ACW976_01520 [Candidatus Ranarchaeia archaeon]
MPTLVFKNKLFVESKEANGDGIHLDFDESNEKIILTVPIGSSLINRLTAQRQANGISKTGYLASSGARFGEGYDVVLEGEGGGVPEKLNHSPRKVF